MDGGRMRRAGRLVTAASLATTFGLLVVLNGTAAGAQAAQASLASGDRRRHGPGICQSARHPAIAARMSSRILAALAGRSSVVGLAVDDRVNGITCKLHPHWQFDSASVVKVTILSALLRKLQQEHRSLTAAQRKLATAMITLSDNDAASTLWAETGTPSLQHFLDLAGMKETELGPGGYWGLTLITAHDELTLLKLLTSTNSVLTTGLAQLRPRLDGPGRLL